MPIVIPKHSQLGVIAGILCLGKARKEKRKIEPTGIPEQYKK